MRETHQRWTQTTEEDRAEDTERRGVRRHGMHEIF